MRLIPRKQNWRPVRYAEKLGGDETIRGRAPSKWVKAGRGRTARPMEKMEDGRMKRFIWITVTMAMLLTAIGWGAAENDFHAWLAQTPEWRGWTAAGWDQWGDWGAALLTRPAGFDDLTQGYALCLAKRQDGGWETVIRDTENLGYTDESEQAAIRFDGGRLILTRNVQYEYADDWTTEWIYELVRGDWRLREVRQTVRGVTQTKDQRPIATESRAWLQDGALQRETLIRDEQTGRVYARKHPGALPDVTDPAWLLPGSPNGDFGCLTATGYDADGKWSRRSQDILARLCAYFFPGENYVDGLYADDALQFIVDKADGTRVLRCGRYEETVGRWEFAESTPLPSGARMGFENVDDAVFFEDFYGVKIGFRNGRWGAVYCYGGEAGPDGGWLRDDWFHIGPNWMGESVSSPEAYGDHPWNDITRMDWSTIPHTRAEAAARMDTGRWATPANPNPADRLNLREAPRTSAGSLGKYYNGAPVEVLEKGKDWCRVRVGAAEGWMMTRYLAFGESAWPPDIRLGALNPAGAQVTVQWQDTGESEVWGPDRDFYHLLVIGVQGDAWYIVWDWTSGRTGRVRVTDLWEGNG